MTPQSWFVFVVVASVAALVVHELGHAAAAGALGGSGLRLVRAWPALRLAVTFPAGTTRGSEAAFLAAGALANLGAAGALFSTSNGMLQAAGLLQLVCAALNLVPVGTSDGARLLALRQPARRGPPSTTDA